MQDGNGVPDVKGIEANVACDRFSEEGWVATSVHAPSETDITVYINHQELVTILCTPTKLNCLILGFLYSEGIISGMGDVASMRVCEDEFMADVMLKNADFQMPGLRTLTSGCGGGSTFKNKGERVHSDARVAPEKVFSLMKQLQERMELYRLSGGVHTAALSDGKDLLVVTEDIGRHNTIDKIQGECLLRNIPTKDRILLCTGRVSSEMLLKAARMQTPVVVSRHTPTARAISLARDLDITLIGHVRGGRMWVYSMPERLGRPRQEKQPTGRSRMIGAQKTC